MVTQIKSRSLTDSDERMSFLGYCQLIDATHTQTYILEYHILSQSICYEQFEI